MTTENIVFAKISQEGGVIISSQNGLEAAYISTGLYKVKFANPLPSVPTIVATCETKAEGSSRIATVQKSDEGGFQLLIKKTAGDNDRTDAAWSFIAAYV